MPVAAAATGIPFWRLLVQLRQCRWVQAVNACHGGGDHPAPCSISLLAQARAVAHRHSRPKAPRESSKQMSPLAGAHTSPRRRSGKVPSSGKSCSSHDPKSVIFLGGVVLAPGRSTQPTCIWHSGSPSTRACAMQSPMHLAGKQ